MLADPFPLKSLSIAAATAITVLETNSFVTIDAGAGKSIRKCASFQVAALPCVTPALLTVGHSVSNENKPAVTDRHAIRLDLDLQDKDGDLLRAFGFMVIGVPQGTYSTDGTTIITPGNVGYALASNLIGALAVNSASAALSNTRLLAILAGEP